MEKLLAKLNIEGTSSKRYFAYVNLVKEQINNYVNVDSLAILNQMQDPNCVIYPEEEQRTYMKISRILVQYFLMHEFDSINLTSKKMKSDKRIDHLQIKRYVIKKFEEALAMWTTIYIKSDTIYLYNLVFLAKIKSSPTPPPPSFPLPSIL